MQLDNEVHVATWKQKQALNDGRCVDDGSYYTTKLSCHLNATGQLNAIMSSEIEIATGTIVSSGCSTVRKGFVGDDSAVAKCCFPNK
jgi:hypothetical protein